MAANGARGEAVVVLAGSERRLCLTLGALAEIETALAIRGIGELAERMRRLSASDMVVVLGALLRGGGEGALADRLGSEPVGLGAAAGAVAAAFAAATDHD